VDDHEHRLAVPAPDLDQLVLDDFAGQSIQRAERLVEQQLGPGGAAERLGVKPTTLRSRLKAWGIAPRDFRAS